MNYLTKLFLIVSLLTAVSSCSEEEAENLSINDVESKTRKSITDIRCHQNCEGDDEGSGGGSATNQSFMNGYNSGIKEGVEFAFKREYSKYDTFRESYESYGSRFPASAYPELESNRQYFRGKYLGIVDGWIAYYEYSVECVPYCVDLPNNIDTQYVYSLQELLAYINGRF